MIFACLEILAAAPDGAGQGIVDSAFLLGCPVEAVLLDGFQAMRDRRFAAGTAGTVFFDPELGAAMKRGELPRSAVDRYSVVVLAGIAAEAQRNGRAEGGQSRIRLRPRSCAKKLCPLS